MSSRLRLTKPKLASIDDESSDDWIPAFLRRPPIPIELIAQERPRLDRAINHRPTAKSPWKPSRSASFRRREGKGDPHGGR